MPTILDLNGESKVGQTYTDATLTGLTTIQGDNVLISPGPGNVCNVNVAASGVFQVISSENQALFQCDDTQITMMKQVYEGQAIVAPRIASGVPVATADQLSSLTAQGTGEAGTFSGYSLSGGTVQLCVIALPDPPATSSGFLSGTTILVGSGENLGWVRAVIDPFAHTASIVGDVLNPSEQTSFHYIIHSY
jgi:hypothetical protein